MSVHSDIRTMDYFIAHFNHQGVSQYQISEVAQANNRIIHIHSEFDQIRMQLF
jgi:hypothetical protein